MKLIILLLVVVNSIIYIGIINQKRRALPDFKLSDYPTLLQGAVFSVLMYIDFIFYLISKSTLIFIFGSAICWLISYIFYIICKKVSDG